MVDVGTSNGVRYGEGLNGHGHGNAEGLNGKTHVFVNGTLTSTSFGRVVNALHHKRLRSLLSRTKGKIVTGGFGETAVVNGLSGEDKALRFPLTVVTDVQAEDALMEE